jgi:ribosome modulation factor
LQGRRRPLTPTSGLARTGGNANIQYNAVIPGGAKAPNPESSPHRKKVWISGFRPARNDALELGNPALYEPHPEERP